MDPWRGKFPVRARRLGALTAVALACSSPAAIAQTAQDGYSAPGGTVQSDVQAGGGGGSPTTPAGGGQQASTGSKTPPFRRADPGLPAGPGGGALRGRGRAPPRHARPGLKPLELLSLGAAA